MEKIKVFISQPMNGKTDETILKDREKAVEKVREALGPDKEIEVLDSFIRGYDPEKDGVKAPGLAYLAMSLALLANADIAYFAPGWSTARGCIIERKCADEYRIRSIAAPF